MREFYHGHDGFAHALLVLGSHALQDGLGPQIGCHDENGVLEGYCPPLAVSHAPIVKDLQVKVPISDPARKRPQLANACAPAFNTT